MIQAAKIEPQIGVSQKECLHKFFCVLQAQFNIECWMHRFERGQRGRQQGLPERGQRDDAQYPAGAVPQVFSQPLNGIHLGQDLFDLPIQCQGFFGGAQTVAIADEKLESELPFRLLQHLADSGLGDVQCFGRYGDAARAQNSVQDFNLPQRDHDPCP